MQNSGITFYSFDCFSEVNFCQFGFIHYELYTFIRAGSGWFGFSQLAFTCISELLEFNSFLCVSYSVMLWWCLNSKWA